MSTTMTMTTTETKHYEKGHHYEELPKTQDHLPPVVVFFSFLNQTSRDWALKHNITHTIRTHLPMGTEVARYHSSEPWSKELGSDLTQAWAVATSLHIDDKVLQPLFQHVYGEPRISDMQGVKAAFDEVGIDPLRFDREYAKASVREEAKWMDECRKNMDIRDVPAVVVAGRYLVKPEAFGSGFNADKVAELIKELLEI